MALLTSRTELNATPDDADLVHIVDVSDTTDNAAGTSKKITRANLVGGLSASGHTHTEADVTDLGAYLENIIEDTAPTLGGVLDVDGHDITSGIGDVVIRMLDDAGANKLSITDSNGVEVALVNSDGSAYFAGNVTVDGYVKINSEPAADHTAKGTVAEFTANENQAFGDVCYIDSAGEMALADADAIATARVAGMCLETVTTGNPADYLLFGIARDDTWAWTVGDPVYLSTTGTTGNTLTQTAPSATGDAVVALGIATHADRILFNPSFQGIVEIA
jgi:flagellar hook-associated protein FlgK